MSFALWGSVGSFFRTGGTAITGQHWDRSQGGSFAGDILWADSATASAGYAVGSPLTYTYYLTSTDRYGDQEDAVSLGTTTMVFPFLTNGGSSSTSIGLAQFSRSGGVDTAGAFYFVAGAGGTYDIKYQALTNTVSNIPGAASAISLVGGAVSLETGIASPKGYTYTADPTNFAFAYSVANGASRDIHLQAFNTAGAATTSNILVGTVANGVQYGLASDGTSIYYAQENNSAANAAIDFNSFNTSSGALGLKFSIPTAFTDIVALDARYISSGTKFFGIAEGVAGASNDTLAVGLFDNTTGVQTGTGANFVMSTTSQVYWQALAIPSSELAGNDQMVLAYVDANAVHLELFNSSGNQVGSDFVVSGLGGFDRIRSLGDGRVEIDYRPSSGTGDPQAYIFDTRTAPITDNGTASNDALVGTTFADTFNGSGGSDDINGGPGTDNAVYANAVSGINATVIGGTGTIVKAGIGTDRVTGIESIVGGAGTDVFTVDSSMFVNGVSGFDFLIEASAGVNLTYGTNFTNISEFVTNVGNNTINASTDPNNMLIYGSTGVDTLSLGTGGGYLFSGGGTGNVLNGGANATNIIIDSGGTSTMNGGTGSAVNFFYVNGTSDTVHGAGAFNAVIYLSTDATYTTFAADGVQEVIFNNGTNVGNGTGSANFLFLYGGAGGDTLTTGAGGGYLIGGGGTNTLTGGGGTNVFIADNAAGIDHMFGGSSSNIYYIDATSDVHGAGAFNTVIELQQNVALVLGSAQLGTNVQQVILNGGTNSADFGTASTAVFLYGGAGADTLKGGTGNDFLYGGTGANTFQFGVGWGKDTVQDWGVNPAGNHLDLTALAGLGVHAITDITQTIVSGNDVITSSHTGTNQITLMGIGSTLAAGSFIFA